MMLKCQQFAEGSPPTPFPSSVITSFNLHFILKHVYKNEQIINLSLSLVLCLVCKSLTSLPRWTPEGVVIGQGRRIHYSIWAASTLIFQVTMWQSQGRKYHPGECGLPSSCWAGGLALAVLTHLQEEEDTVGNPGYNRVSSLCHVLFPCAGQCVLSQAMCSASWVFCVFDLEPWKPWDPQQQRAQSLENSQL